MKKLLDFLAFQTCWLACVAGAGRGWPWLGPPVVALFLATRLALARDRRSLLGLAAVAAGLGVIADGLLTVTRVLTFAPDVAGPWPPVPPLWMVALWVAFALTLRCSLGWLAGRLPLAAALGAVAGPLAYTAGERLGAVTLARPAPVAIAVLALTWGIATPLLASMAGPGKGSRRRPAADS